MHYIREHISFRLVFAFLSARCLCVPVCACLCMSLPDVACQSAESCCLTMATLRNSIQNNKLLLAKGNLQFALLVQRMLSCNADIVCWKIIPVAVGNLHSAGYQYRLILMT